MSKRGRLLYIPPDILKEIESIQKDIGTTKPGPPLYKMVEYCKIGREVERMRDKFLLADIWKKKKK